MTHGKDEYLLQVAAMKHIAVAFPGVKAFHVANENKDATSRYFNKQKGVLPGVSDIILAWPGRNVGVIELKTATGKLSNNQNRFLSAMHAYGWSTGVARSVKEVHEIMKQWGLKPVTEFCREPDYADAFEKLHRGQSYFKDGKIDFTPPQKTAPRMPPTSPIPKSPLSSTESTLAF